MYALYSKPRASFVVDWSRDKSAEDITRALALMGDECPYKWDVKVDRRCGAISVTLDTGLDEPAVAQQGKVIEITNSRNWTNYGDATPEGDLVYVPKGRRMGVVYDAHDLDDLRDLAYHGHRVSVMHDRVIVDRESYLNFILEDADGNLSALPYGHPRDYAIAMDLRCELLPMSE